MILLVKNPSKLLQLRNRCLLIYKTPLKFVSFTQKASRELTLSRLLGFYSVLLDRFIKVSLL